MEGTASDNFISLLPAPKQTVQQKWLFHKQSKSGGTPKVFINLRDLINSLIYSFNDRLQSVFVTLMGRAAGCHNLILSATVEESSVADAAV